MKIWRSTWTCFSFPEIMMAQSTPSSVGDSVRKKIFQEKLEEFSRSMLTLDGLSSAPISQKTSVKLEEANSQTPAPSSKWSWSSVRVTATPTSKNIYQTSSWYPISWANRLISKYLKMMTSFHPHNLRRLLPVVFILADIWLNTAMSIWNKLSPSLKETLSN